MDSLVPSFVSVGGVNFPLEANQFGVGLASSAEQLEALRYAIDEMVNGDSREVPLETLSRQGFRVQELRAVPVAPASSLGSLADGPINWRRLSGSWPDLADAFLVRAGFLQRDLVVPRHVLIELVSRLRALRSEILVGKREARIDETEVPPLRPLTPELEEYETLRKDSPDEAYAYAGALYERRG